ncbi:MAG: hypothetical protein ACOX5R_22425 [bacterium]
MMILAFVSQSQAVTLSNALQITENHILIAQIGQFDSQAEIGRPANAAFPEGSAASSSDTEYELYHAGGDIENASDQAYFVYREVTGNFLLEAEEVYIFAFGDPTWTKTGLMVRESLDAGARNFFSMVRNDGALRSQVRSETGGNTTVIGPDGNLDWEGPIQLLRLGDTCYTYYYRNGERVLQGQQMLDLPDTLLAGLALAANEPGLMAGSAFSGVNFVSIPISCERVFPIDEFTPGQPISGIQVRASIPVGVTSSAVITETPPAGWSISNVQATAGDVSVTTEAIVWSLDNASGNPVLTYDVTPLQDAVTGQWSGSVSLSDLTFPVPVTGAARLTSANEIFVYLIGSGNPALPRNGVYANLLGEGQTVYQVDGTSVFVPGLGYQVDFISDDEDNPEDAAGYDVVIVIESVTPGNVSRYVDQPVPYLIMEQALASGDPNLPGSGWFAPASGVVNQSEDSAIKFVDTSHPVSSFWASDEDQIIEFTLNPIAQLAGIVPDQLASAAMPLAANIDDATRYTLVIAEQGAVGFSGNTEPPAGSDPAPARRAYLGFHEGSQVYNLTASGDDNVALTKDAAILYQRLVQWLIGVPVTADGTNGGTAVREWSLF